VLFRIALAVAAHPPAGKRCQKQADRQDEDVSWPCPAGRYDDSISPSSSSRFATVCMNLGLRFTLFSSDTPATPSSTVWPNARSRVGGHEMGSARATLACDVLLVHIGGAAGARHQGLAISLRGQKTVLLHYLAGTRTAVGVVNPPAPLACFVFAAAKVARPVRRRIAVR